MGAATPAAIPAAGRAKRRANVLDNLFPRVSFASVLGFALLFGGAAAAHAAGAPDLAVKAIDISGLSCGPCGGRVEVEIANTGNALGTAYTVWVELRVTPAGDSVNAKTYKQQLSGFHGEGSRRVAFDGIVVRSCYQAASAFEAKVYFTGGNLREGNTSNNQRRLAEPIRRVCPGSSNTPAAQPPASPTPRPTATPYSPYTRPAPAAPTPTPYSPYTRPTPPPSGGTTPTNTAATGAPDLAVAAIDTRGAQCGGCPGSVEVNLSNSGRAIGTAYTVWVELRVVGAGDSVNARTYKQQLSGFPTGSRSVRFDGVTINRCYQAASTFEAKVYVTGGDLREGNVHNNRKSVSVPISTRCAGR
jgi:hypothetical protein